MGRRTLEEEISAATYKLTTENFEDVYPFTETNPDATEALLRLEKSLHDREIRKIARKVWAPNNGDRSGPSPWKSRRRYPSFPWWMEMTVKIPGWRLSSATGSMRMMTSAVCVVTWRPSSPGLLKGLRLGRTVQASRLFGDGMMLETGGGDRSASRLPSEIRFVQC